MDLEGSGWQLTIYLDRLVLQGLELDDYPCLLILDLIKFKRGKGVITTQITGANGAQRNLHPS
jgi:hypothetical protein